MINLGRKRWRDARSEALKRNIAYNITYDEYMAWWLSHGIDKSAPSLGKTTGQKLCMCRKNDSGPYDLTNIYCDTMSNNNKHSWLWNPKRSQTSCGQGPSMSIQTPKGIFPSVAAAARAYNLTPAGLHYRRKTKPDLYYYL
jgi:hypothetical protein